MAGGEPAPVRISPGSRYRAPRSGVSRGRRAARRGNVLDSAAMTTDTSTPSGPIRERLLAQVREYLAVHGGIEADRVRESTRFREDLNLDSLDLAALAVEWEDEFKVVVEDERIVTCTTVGGAIDLVLELTGDSPS